MLAAGDVHMGGYGLWTSRGSATGAHDPLTVQTLCLEAGDAVCIAVVDSLGLPAPVIREIQNEVADRTGLAATQILIAATHTHAAPDLLGLWGGAPDAYRSLLIATTADAVTAAWQAREQATLVHANARAPSKNRRSWDPDDLMAVLEARNATGGVIATLVNFAAHPVVTPMSNLQLSSDYVQGLRDAIHTETGAPVVFVNGALGDASPAAPEGATRFERAERYGHALGSIALAALQEATPIQPRLSIVSTTVSLTVENRVLRFANWLGLLAQSLDGGVVAAPLTYLSLGNSVEAVSLPGEALAGLGREIRETLHAPSRMILGLTGGSLGYFVPESEWETGRNDDYEETLALSRTTASELLAATRPLTHLPSLELRGRMLATQLTGRLRSSLMRAMQSGGPASAVGVCAIEAPVHTAAITAGTDWSVSRISLRARNPNAAPDAWARTHLSAWENGEAPRQVSGLEDHEFRLLIAQPVQPVCLTCHGKRLAGDVRTAIAEHYPDDRATGYALGDVRGAIYLRKALP